MTQPFSRQAAIGFVMLDIKNKMPDTMYNPYRRSQVIISVCDRHLPLHSSDKSDFKSLVVISRALQFVLHKKGIPFYQT